LGLRLDAEDIRMGDAEVVAEIIAEKIDPADIFHLVSQMAKLRDEGREPNWYSQIGILAERFPRGSQKPLAIMERMQALIPTLKDRRAKGWSFDGVEPGCTITHEAIFRAAALAPLHWPNGRKLKFKREEFFRIVLEQTESTGTVA
jgi:hypothetical protein